MTAVRAVAPAPAAVIDRHCVDGVHPTERSLELVELIRGKKVMLGATDIATETVETPEEVAEVLRRALEFVDADKLIPSSNRGTARIVPTSTTDTSEEDAGPRAATGHPGLASNSTP